MSASPTSCRSRDEGEASPSYQSPTADSNASGGGILESFEGMQDLFGGPPLMTLEVMRQRGIVCSLFAVWAVIIAGVIIRIMAGRVYWECHNLCNLMDLCEALEYAEPWNSSSCSTSSRNVTTREVALLPSKEPSGVHWANEFDGISPLHRYIVPTVQLHLSYTHQPRSTKRVEDVASLPGAKPVHVSLHQRVSYADGTLLDHVLNRITYCTSDLCDFIFLVPVGQLPYVRHIEIGAISTTEVIDPVFSRISVMLQQPSYTLLTVIIRYALMLLALCMGVVYIQIGYARRPKHLLPEQYGLLSLLPLLIMSLNPFLLPSLWSDSHIIWMISLYLEYHWAGNFARFMCACVWVTVMFIGSTSEQRAWYRRPGLLHATLWWLVTFGLDVAEIVIGGITTRSPYGVYSCSENIVLCTLFSVQVGATCLIVLCTLYSYVVAVNTLKSRPYLQTRSRRLALLFFSQLLLCYFVCCVIFLVGVFIPQFRHSDTYELQEVSNFDSWLGGQSMVAVVTLVMAIAYAPLRPKASNSCPPPYDRRWVEMPWEANWLWELRANGGCEMYFFYFKQEQIAHAEAQKQRVMQTSLTVDVLLENVLTKWCHIPERTLFYSEHLFCLETCIDMFNLAWQAYNRPRRISVLGGPSVSLALSAVGRGPEAFDEADLDLSHLPWKLLACIRRSHNQAIVASAPNAVAVAFRGTVNWVNVRTDLQWKHSRSQLGHLSDVRYPLRRPCCCIRRAPKVHQGFHHAYQQLREDVMQALRHACQEQLAADGRHPVVYITGHSLGGAIATLCAYDFASQALSDNSNVDVRCYTFGAPRVGNAAFAAVYNLTVPETYRICNECDFICNGPFSLPCLGGHYRHAGRRVLVDGRGNLVIDPLVVERIFKPTKGAYGQAHMMAEYRKSLDKVCAYFGLDLRCSISGAEADNSDKDKITNGNPLAGDPHHAVQGTAIESASISPVQPEIGPPEITVQMVEVLVET